MPVPVGAQVAGQTVAPGWVHEHWTAADGLPVNAVNAVVQGKGGYIWLATFDGLVRFDGVRFTVFNSATHPNLPSNRFTELVRTEDGALWLLSEQHHLIRFQENEFTVFDTEAGLPHNDVFVLRPEPDGSLVIGTRGGVARYRHGKVEQLAANGVTGTVHCLLRGPDLPDATASQAGKALWIGTNEGVFRRGSDGVTQHVLPVGRLPGSSVRALAFVDRSVWIGTTAGISVWEDGVVRPLPGAEALSEHTVFSIVQVGETFWFNTFLGIYGYRAGRIVHRPEPEEQFTPPRRMAWTDAEGVRWVNTGRRLLRNGQTIFRSGSVLSPVTKDHEGNVWLPAEDGLHRLRASPFETYRKEDGLRSENVYPILETADLPDAATSQAGGTIWLGTRSGELTRIRNGVVRTYGSEAGVPDIVWALEEGRNGVLWVGGNLCRFQGSVCRRDGIPQELASATVRAIHNREDSSVWFGTHNGLFRLANGEWIRFGPDDGVPHQPVRAFLEGPDDALWMGTNGGGIVRFKDEAFTTFTAANGLCSDLVRALHFDDGGALWVGTEDRGLCRLPVGQTGVETTDGDISGANVLQVDQRHGLYDHGVHRILDDGMGRLWMSGNRGIWWVTKEDLDAFVAGEQTRIHSTAYTEEDGLPTREANGGVHPAGIRASDGRLWFPTQAGAVVFDPLELPRNTLRPPVHIEQVAVGTGEKRRTLAGFEISDHVVLGPDERQVEIAYTAPSFIDPANVRFRYRLEGFDEDWVDAGNRRLATYTNLRPGEYRFHVIAANADGVWNETGASFEMRVRPKWYETRTFLGLCALLLVAAGLAVGLWRRRESERRRRELETQVEARTEELSEALETVAEQAAALEDLDKAKSRFFANISHEFRTPLTVILGGIRDTVAGRFGKVPESVVEQQQAMLRNTRQLHRLIDEVLDLNRLEVGKLALDPAPGDLSRFLEGLVEANAPLAERNGIDLTFNEDAEHCLRNYDAEKLEKIAGNLLSNALKFTPKGGSVSVTLHCGDEVEISVADDGPGIPAEVQEQIFKRFEQLEGAGHSGGSGIGLALARELAELHGGTITLESEPDEGSTFTVQLPLDKAALDEVVEVRSSAPAEVGEQSPQKQEESALVEGVEAVGNGADRTTVLVIEDNDDVRAYVRRSLEGTYRVFGAADGDDGLRKAREALPDLVVSDVMLPGIDGYEVARRLKADPDTECIPVVMLTARAAEEDQTKGYGAGAEAYLTKPFSPETLRAAIARLLEERLRLRRRLQEQGEKDDEKKPNGHATLRARAVVLERLYDEDFGVDELAVSLGMSARTLYRRLKPEAGLPPGDFIRRIRLEQARELLSNGAGSVSEVAYAIGYRSLSHFTHTFRKHYGTPPSNLLGAQEG